VDPVPDPLLLRKCGSAGNRTRASGYVARNSDHYTRGAVHNNRRTVQFCEVRVRRNIFLLMGSAVCHHKPNIVIQTPTTKMSVYYIAIGKYV
jgi:hypothetical protein